MKFHLRLRDDLNDSFRIEIFEIYIFVSLKKNYDKLNDRNVHQKLAVS